MKVVLDQFGLLSYELTELDFSDREVNDPFVQLFIANIDSLLITFKV